MALKRLLVPLTGSGEDAPALATALALAKTTGAHVDALFLGIDAQQEFASGACFPPAVIDHVMSAALVERFIRQADSKNEKRRARARSLFHGLVQDSAAAFDAEPGAKALSARFIEATSTTWRAMADHGRLCDLIVLARTFEDGAEAPAGLEAALCASGRPVLITQQAMFPGFAKSIAIVWNGSVEAARTIGFAMPLLEQAHKVVVFAVEGGKPSPQPDSELIEYLAWHNISAVSASVGPASCGADGVLLSAAREHKVDLVMLGACSGGDLRRLAFSRAIGAMLAESRLPLLMMH